MTTALVIGSGIAGLTVALRAAQAGVAVTLATKDVLEHANTRYAQGGIAGVMFADDRVDDHAHDTLVAGAGLADAEAVRVLVGEGPDRIRELIDLGVAFDRGPDGAFVRGLEGAHSYPRILHSGGDATGSAIESALVAAVRRSGVEIIEHAFLIDLVVEGGEARGAELLIEGRERRSLRADAVVLATGGAGQLYAHTTNPVIATGDGIAAALRAGAAVADLEFVQFHPTVLAAGEPFLISEAVRGEGATLIDADGCRFALAAHPDGELAPRDVVARAIAARMSEQHGRPVLLDATGLGPARGEDAAAFLARRFPTIDRAVRERGLDWAREPIPVTPAAHYLMGGVATDLDGRTSIPRLFAVGEVARTGVHGANRLASNSLLEGAVFAARAAAALAGAPAAAAPPPHPAPTPPTPAPLSQIDVGGPSRGRSVTAEGPRPGAKDAWSSAPGPFTRTALQRIMSEHVGVMRDERGLRRAAAAIATWRAAARTPRTPAQFEDENLLQLAAATVGAALARRTSVGAHYRRDDAVAAPDAAGDAFAQAPALAGAVAC
ncbi:FAD-dependent oxidoreductase [Microbacterium sp. LRZ72]|uniref:L-aspartate oxidase n=1 Tax=Microbacterium sp. LRZ72 TaxID=2942481 RepID=UPI0029B8D444|nr:FAD-dependent oxidoreductase [Microbacterium sp. LRZ72]MDX2375773.1 FAD-dependent oxidoreductase [Microbacterium sp. LRZ72]